MGICRDGGIQIDRAAPADDRARRERELTRQADVPKPRQPVGKKGVEVGEREGRYVASAQDAHPRVVVAAGGEGGDEQRRNREYDSRVAADPRQHAIPTQGEGGDREQRRQPADRVRAAWEEGRPGRVEDLPAPVELRGCVAQVGSEEQRSAARNADRDEDQA